MKACQSDGTLRAFQDGELAPDEMAGVEQHLAECGECAGRRVELAGRAAFALERIGALEVEATRVVEMRPRLGRRVWAGVAAALAAGLAIAMVSWPKRPVPPPVRVEASVKTPPVVARA
jgi:anti-sigma factor RsiW